MNMHVTISPEDLAGITLRVIERVEAETLREVRSLLNPKQLAAEVKNGVIKRLADQLAADLKTGCKVEEALHRALQSAESRVNTEIQKRLTGGIVVRFGDMPA